MRERLAEQNIAIERPTVIPVAVWAMAAEIMADGSGKAARIWLQRLSKRYPHAVGAIRVAALVPLDQGGALYLWSDERARAIAALGCSLLELGRNTRRKGRYRIVVMGVARAAFAALLRNPYSGEQPSISALAGRHREDASLLTGQLGYLRALEAAGFCYRQQVRDQREPCEVGFPSGHPPNRYWLVARPVHDVPAATLVALLELERLGWAVNDGPARVSRGDRAAAIAGEAAALPPPDS